MPTLNPLLKSKTRLLIVSAFILISPYIFAQKTPHIERQSAQTVTIIELNKLADVKIINIGNLQESIFRDPATHALIKKESTYDYSQIGGGKRNDLVYFNQQDKPAYIRSTTTNNDGLLIKAVEELRVVKDVDGYLWNFNNGTPLAYKYTGDTTKKTTITLSDNVYKPYFVIPANGYTGYIPIQSKDKWMEDIHIKVKAETAPKTTADNSYGNGGTVTSQLKPFLGFSGVGTETVEYKDAKGLLRKKVYREYYDDGWMYEEFFYYDCNGKLIHYDSSLYDDFGEEWEYMEMEYVDGKPIAGYRDIADEDEEGYYDFREYYNPFKNEFEEDPLGDPGWSKYNSFSFNSDKLDDPCCNFKRFQVFIGPSLIIEDYSDDEKLNMWGVKAEISRFFSCKIGATLDIGYNTGSILDTKYSKLNILGGLTWAPTEKWGLDKKFTFSVHALAGVQLLKSKFEYGGYSDSDKNTAFTAAVGPRLDFRLSDKWYAGIGADYMPVFGDNQTANNYRFLGGVRFDF